MCMQESWRIKKAVSTRDGYKRLKWYEEDSKIAILTQITRREGDVSELERL